MFHFAALRPREPCPPRNQPTGPSEAAQRPGFVGGLGGPCSSQRATRDAQPAAAAPRCPCASARGARCPPHPAWEETQPPAPTFLYRFFSVIGLQDKAEISNTSERIFYTCLVTECLKCMISTRIDYLEPDPEEAGWLGNCLTVW